MKTPREILLHKHRAAESQLDAAREKALDAMRPQQAPVEKRGVATFLSELFRLPRPALIGLGAAWAVIIVLNLASDESATPQAAVMANQSPAVREALAEQHRLYTELVRSASPADVPAFVPRPRTELESPVATA